MPRQLHPGRQLLGLHPNYLHRLVSNLDLKAMLKSAANADATHANPLLTPLPARTTFVERTFEMPTLAPNPVPRDTEPSSSTFFDGVPVFAQAGLPGSSMRDISRATGVRLPALLLLLKTSSISSTDSKYNLYICGGSLRSRLQASTNLAERLRLLVLTTHRILPLTPNEMKVLLP